MSRQSKEQRLAIIHEEAISEFDDIQTAMHDERLQCLQDRRFYSIAGSQWEGSLGEQFENKPKFEFNKIHLSVIRIINEYRNNRITVDFVSKEGKENDKLAETCDDLYRADEQDSDAEEAYDNAFEESVAGGFGAWRLRTVFENEEDEEDERQMIRIEPIYDADSSVFFDLGAKRMDKSDAKRCFIITSMTHNDYKEEWDDDPTSWTKDIQQSEFDWVTPNVVFIAEYYRVEETSENVYIWENLSGEEERYKDSDFEADEKLEERLMAIGSKEVRQKSVKRRRVHKYILSGSKILEDCGYIAGKFIPVVPVYGKRWFVDNVERCMGHVRLAKDAQRLKNMQLSKLGEISSLSSIEKPIFTPEQIAGHNVMWAEDNVKNFPYLLINPITDLNGNQAISGPIGYTKPPQLSQALATLLQITEQDMRDMLGNQQAGEELQPNISGKAVELIQNKLDMQTNIYMTNMGKAIKRSGEIWLSMAKDIFVEEGRKMKSIGTHGELKSVELSRPIINDKGEMVIENDLSQAEFDVAVDVGPSSSSKRASAVRALTGMLSLTDDPETKQVLGAMVMMNMEGEGIAEAQDYFRKKLLRMGVAKPTEEESKVLEAEMANQQPSSNDMYLQAAADEATANATQARAKTILTVAQAEETKAKTMKTIADIDSSDQRQAMEVIEKFGGLDQAQKSLPQT